MPILLTETFTLPQVFAARVAQTPDGFAYSQYTETGWVRMTWAETAREVGRWQAALRKEGLQPGDRVAVAARNCIEWVLFDQAALALGLVVVPLYFNDRPDNMAWCLNDSGARLLLLENPALWPALHRQVPSVQRMVSLSRLPPEERAVYIKDWLPAVAETAPAASFSADKLATIVYTSGTTGRPKGVMLSHRNIISDLIALIEAVPEVVEGAHQFLSFLPLSHMFERTVGYYIPVCIGAGVTYARGIPELAEDLQSQRPIALVSVPRIFERVYSKLDAALPAGSLKRRLFQKTVTIGWKRFEKQATTWENLLWLGLNLLVARKIRARFGGRLRFVFIGGAAMDPRLSRVFTGLGFTLLQGYGLTETAPVLSCNRVQDNDPASVGRPLAGVEIRTAENGELLVRGPIIMQGYWNNPEATKAVIEQDGWFRTGDLVEIRNGKIYITGRVKDIIVLSNGEKIAPTDAEQAISTDPAFEQVMVVGEGRPALGLLVVSPLQDEKELCARANKQLDTFPGYVRIRYIARVTEAWTVENGLLTPTLKLKRSEVGRRFGKEIEAMYLNKAACQETASSSA